MLFFARLSAVAGLLVLAALPLVAQDRAADRRRFLAPASQTTDDPRRVLVGNAPRGPDGSIVLTGGRVFDGTGAPAREMNVVIEKFKTFGVQPKRTPRRP